MDIISYSLLILILAHQSIAEECLYLNGDPSANSSKQSGCGKLLNRQQEATINQQNLPAQFTCQSDGRFPDMSDPTCTKYFQCDALIDGTFRKTSVQCPNSTYCSDTQTCSSVHVCPCARVQVLELPQATTNAASTTSCQFSATATTDFTCTDVGRFPDFSDRGCQKYFLCTLLHNGTFIKTAYTCKKSVFDPDIERCSVTYFCPCNITTITSSSSPTTTIITSSSTNEASTSTTTLSSVLTSNSLSTIYDCTVSLKEFQCTIAGNFPDFSDVTCKNYFICSNLQNSTFIKTLDACKQSTFDPLTFRCSANYICPCNGDQSTSETTSLAPSVPPSEGITAAPVLTTPSLCSPALPEFTCSSKGRFPDLSDFTCQRYYLCSQLRNGSFIKTEYRCPDSIFHPLTEQCSTDYACPCVTTESPTTSVPSDGTTVPLISSTVASNGSETTVGCTLSFTEFECSVNGRFPDLSDPSCRKYFLCTQLRNGTCIKTPYLCLKSTFNPLIHQCSTSFICPCTVGSTSITTSSSFSEGFTKIPSTTVATIGTTPSYRCGSNDITEFKCTTSGRFPDYYDINCRRYFLCSVLSNGTYVKTPYSCPKSSCMNPSTQKCSTSFTCPCSE